MAQQQEDPEIAEITRFLKTGALPDEPKKARLITFRARSMLIDEGVLYWMDEKANKRAVVPHHLRQQILEQAHGGRMAGHFAVKRTYQSLVKVWWWEGMYTDVKAYCSNCPQCAIVSGTGRAIRPLLHPIPVQKPFQIVGNGFAQNSCRKQPCGGFPGLLI